MICEYVNKRQKPPCDGPDVAPVCGFLSENFYMQPIITDPASEDYWYPQAIMELNNAGYTPQRFIQVKHIFVPTAIQRPSDGIWHAFLVVISPLARTIDYLDSGNCRPEKDLMGHFFHLLALHLGRAFDPREWRMRLNGSTKQALKSTDCGIFTGANAAAVALGYHLNFHGRNILNR